MRCFIAVNIDNSIKTKIIKLQHELTGDIKYVAPENLHFTLKFLGEIDGILKNEIEKIIKTICADFSSFYMNIEGMGCFPNKTRPHVLWVGAGEGCKIFSELAKTLDNELEKTGFKKEKDYIPHLTIARIKSGRHNIPEFLKKFENIELGTLRIEEIVLFKSVLTKKGPIYENIYSMKLA